MRASIYNAMPIEGVKYLVEFMKSLKRQISKKGDVALRINTTIYCV